MKTVIEANNALGQAVHPVYANGFDRNSGSDCLGHAAAAERSVKAEAARRDRIEVFEM